jgi:hypothetical protein
MLTDHEAVKPFLVVMAKRMSRIDIFVDEMRVEYFYVRTLY